eukprot:1824779-Rhodomonas_salina.1
MAGPAQPAVRAGVPPPSHGDASIAMYNRARLRPSLGCRHRPRMVLHDTRVRCEHDNEANTRMNRVGWSRFPGVTGRGI